MKTKNGKEIEFYNEGFATKVRFKGGGLLPKELRGSWTNPGLAKRAAEQYIESKGSKKEEE